MPSLIALAQEHHSALLQDDFWIIWDTIKRGMATVVWYLTALLASSSMLPSSVGGVTGVKAQSPYLLGLGEFLIGFWWFEALLFVY